MEVNITYSWVTNKIKEIYLNLLKYSTTNIKILNRIQMITDKNNKEKAKDMYYWWRINK